jgi:AcrR family transcriptional regulator
LPKKVDHSERRSAIAKVVRDLVQEAGVESLTIKGVADRVGYSASVVVHYFVNKRDMILFTQMDSRKSIERVIDGARRKGFDLFGCLAPILPCTNEMQSYWHLFFAFWGMATYDEDLAAERLSAVSDAQSIFVNLVTDSQSRDMFDRKVDPLFAASNIQIALNGIAGLSVQDVTAWPAERQRHFLLHHLRVLGYRG